nr:disease resistance-like protein DSC1 [Quercus suber]
MQLVGINSRVEAVAKLLDIESNDVRMVGITGLGGIGKTTIAKAIYNSSFSNHFKAKSFVENVREGSKTEEGKIRLQQTLLKGISKDKNFSVDNLNEGTTRINRILRLKRVLIILDDVDNADQIETLLGQCECFAGSRIILTTRYKSLLGKGKGLSTCDYGVEELDEDEAIKLFRKHAFPSNEVPEDYLELEKQAISYAKGLPLALKVMGRDLCGKPIDEWNEALDYYETNLHEDIQKILRRSYEGLTEDEKIIFLDIACFFKGYDMSYNMIKDVLKACGLNPYGIRKLIDKGLLTIDEDNYYLSMHDLLQQMGMDIVRQEAPLMPGERSRLWCYEEALDVLTEDMGSDKIQSMILWPPKSEPEEVQLKAQFFEIDDSVGCLDKLEELVLFFCEKLETLPNCLTMKSLRHFDLGGCGRIKKFPTILHKMKGVKYLCMGGNYTNELPLSFGNLIGLKGLEISPYSGEAHLPGSIYNLQSIERLELNGNFIFPKNVEIDRQPMCNSLGCSSKYVFPMLKQLKIYGFKIRSEIEFILNCCCPLTLEVLEIQYCIVVTLPESMSRCERLHKLTIRDCHSLDLQSLFQLLPEIIGLPPNLPPCLGVTSHMLMFPHSSTMLPPWWQECHCEFSSAVTGEENDFPNWFNHQRDGNLISFSIGPEFPTIALCTAFGIQDSCCDFDFDYYVFISINGSERIFGRNFFRKRRSCGHLYFSCRLQSSLQELFRDSQLTDRNHVEILCETFPDPFRDPLSREIAPPIVTRIGVRVECNCLSLQSGLGLPMDTENGSDLGSAFDSSNVDGFDLGSSSVAQAPVNDDFDSNQFPLWGRMARLLIRLFVMIIVAYTEGVSDGDAMQISTVNTNLMISMFLVLALRAFPSNS